VPERGLAEWAVEMEVGEPAGRPVETVGEPAAAVVAASAETGTAVAAVALPGCCGEAAAAEVPGVEATPAEGRSRSGELGGRLDPWVGASEGAGEAVRAAAAGLETATVLPTGADAADMMGGGSAAPRMLRR
jgi:hypothetical protein